MEVRGLNIHFIDTKRMFVAPTSISSPPNGSSRLELPFHRPETDVRGLNIHFIDPKRMFAA
jgi:hypothetical protein